jgi:hypothetical protein
MCVGLPALGLIASVGQAVAGIAGDNAAYQAQKQQYKANLENAKTATFDRFESINNRVIQESDVAAQQLQENSIEGLKARSSARVAAAEGGVSGGSVDAIVTDMLAKESRFAVNTQTNFNNQVNYWRGEGAAAAAQGQSQVNSVPKPTKPSPFAHIVNLFGSAVNSFG